MAIWDIQSAHLFTNPKSSTFLSHFLWRIPLGHEAGQRVRRRCQGRRWFEDQARLPGLTTLLGQLRLVTRGRSQHLAQLRPPNLSQFVCNYCRITVISSYDCWDGHLHLSGGSPFFFQRFSVPFPTCQLLVPLFPASLPTLTPILSIVSWESLGLSLSAMAFW